MMDWAAFQEFVKAIQEDLVPGFVLENVEFEKDSLGIERQLDAVIRNAEGPYQLRILVEATTRAEKLGVENIDAFVAKSKRLDCQKMVVVSATGFTQPALDAAKGEGMETWTLRQVEEEDVEGTIGKVGVTVNFSSPRAHSFNMQVDPDPPAFLNGTLSKSNRDQLFIYDSAGNIRGNIWDFIEANKDIDGQHQFASTTDDYLFGEGRKCKFLGFSFVVTSQIGSSHFMVDMEKDLVAVYENAQDSTQRRFIFRRPGLPAVFLPLSPPEMEANV